MKKHLLTLLITGLLVAVIGLACGSESAETEALYTDAKQMFENINGAFQLPQNSQARVDTMRRIIAEKWDQQVVTKLETYLGEAPEGKHAVEAKQLLEEVRNSMYIRLLGQARPLLEQTGMPQTPADTDSMIKQMESAEPDSQ